MKTSLLIFINLISVITGISALRCSPGTYKDKKECKDCPAGTYNAFAGAQGKDLCRPCPAGTFNSLRGQYSLEACKPCAGNLSSPSGSAQCILCAPGSFVAPTDSGIPQCILCDAGKFSVKANMFECTECPEGQVAPIGSSSCKDCPAGMGPSFEKETCEQCTSGFFNDGTLKDCSRCPFGLRGNVRNGATKCVGCPLGRALDRFLSGRCDIVCGPGENSIKPRPLCVKDGTPCPSNHFEDKKGVCRTCTTLQRYNPRKKRCVPCPRGKRSRGNLDKKCVRCPRGRVLVGNRCLCPEGFGGAAIGECTICSPGTRWLRQFSGLASCLRCPLGTFASEAGSLKCQACPEDLIQPAEGQSSCVECPEGLIASTLFRPDYGSTARYDDPVNRFSVEFGRTASRSACVSPQTNCPPGLERVMDKEGRFFCQAEACPVDSFEVSRRPVFFGRKVRICLNCPQGTFLDKTRRRCRSCKFNEISEGGMVSECTPCPRNYNRETLLDGTQKCTCITNVFGMEPKQLRLLPDGRCRRCPAGTTGNVGTTICTECPAGMTEGSNRCFNCRAGSFTNVSGTTAVGPTVSDCEKCPDGTLTYGIGETECVRIGGR